MVVEHARDCPNSNLGFPRYVIYRNGQSAPVVSNVFMEGLPKNVGLFGLIVKRKLIFLKKDGRRAFSSKKLEEKALGETYIVAELQRSIRIRCK